MKLKYILILPLLVATLLVGSEHSCYSVDSSGLTTDKPLGSFKSIMVVDSDVKNFKEIFFMLLDNSYERIEAAAFLFCAKDKSGYSCQAECDGGSMHFTKKLNIDKISVYPTEMNNRYSKFGEEEEHILVKKKRGRSIVSVKRMKCPKITKALYSPQRDKRDVKEKLYVCYNEKEKRRGSYKYYGCRLRNELCMYGNMAYFGHYGNPSDAKAALKRCKRSTPRE